MQRLSRAGNCKEGYLTASARKILWAVRYIAIHWCIITMDLVYGKKWCNHIQHIGDAAVYFGSVVLQYKQVNPF